jgi:hypothetical protein
MGNSQRYAEVLTKVLRRVAIEQPSLQDLKIRAVCDSESGQFLVIGTGWNQTAWRDLILFHAWLKDGKIVVEDNNFENMMEMLLEGGIVAEDLISVEEIVEIDRSMNRSMADVWDNSEDDVYAELLKK